MPGRAQGKAHERPRARGTQRACNAALRPARHRPLVHEVGQLVAHG